ncbi:hypothetical protein FOA52_015053 [Chlamydomonas sp. UWO 241]|nr:hypothetical protein FOA52_015053 [Chlamydomonas sp. UWO 241]
MALRLSSVDWYPWTPEALERARAEQKPIFLSVGYATCHWCHVMERESFECEETAKLMNASFINIKVDREERPDVDRVYMSYVQATTGRGGWPMSVFLTPDLEPIYGGSYYPREDIVQGGQLAVPSFRNVLTRIATLWGSQREELSAASADMMRRLAEHIEGSVGTPVGDGVLPGDVAEAALLGCQEALSKRFDQRLGGFGSAPKFPRPCEIEALTHAYAWHKARGEEVEADKALWMATVSLDKMAAGGVYDHIGGGFHRYSVDEHWHVPHFEKMLYDAPQLVQVYLQAFQISGDLKFARVARGVLDYLRRDLSHPEGGFFSAEDADSADPSDGVKREGAFYVWTSDEVRAALPADLAELFCAAYNIQPEGNCTLSAMSDPHEEFVGKNVPIWSMPLSQLAHTFQRSEADVQVKLSEAHRKLHTRRAGRPRPGLDDKVVTAWNGMAIGAMARASRILEAEVTACLPLFPVDGCPAATYLQCALRCAHFVRMNLYHATSGQLCRTYRDGQASVPGFADDYAQMVSGLLDLYECGGGLEWLRWAMALQATLDRLFWDGDKGGYFSTSGVDPSIKIRIKDDYDGAEPAVSSIAAANLLRLAALVPHGTPVPAPGTANSDSHEAAGAAREEASSSTATAEERSGGETSSSGGKGGGSGFYDARARAVLAAFGEKLSTTPMAIPKMCCAAYLSLRSPLRTVIIAGRRDCPGARALLNAAHRAFATDKAVVLIDPSDAEDAVFYAAHNPGALAMVRAHFDTRPDSPATAFVCQDYTCQAPTADPDRLAELLSPKSKQKPKVLVLRPEDGSDRLAIKIMEPMLSLIKNHTLRTCTLDRDTNAALPVLTMLLQLATLFGDASVELPMLLLLRCHINGALQLCAQRASLRSHGCGHDTTLLLRDPMLSLMRGRRTLSWSLAPAPGNAGPLPEMTVELGDYDTCHRPPPASESPPSKRTTRVTTCGGHGAPVSSEGGGTGDGPQAQGMRARKRCAADAANAAATGTPPAKKSQAHRKQLPSGAAKGAQERKLPKTSNSSKGVVVAESKYHGVRQNHSKSGRWEACIRAGSRRLCLGIYDTCEGAACVYDFAVLSLHGVDTQTAINFDKGTYLGADGALLPAEAALPGLGRNQHRLVRGKLAAAGMGAAGAAEEGSGVCRKKSGRWQAWIYASGRTVPLGTYDTDVDAARVSDFAVLPLRGVDTLTAINFDKGAYLGADGALLPVEAALPGLGRDQYKNLREKLAAAVLGAGCQVVVTRPEDGSGRLAIKIMEPMLSLIKRHTLRTCTLDRDANAALPVLTMVLASLRLQGHDTALWLKDPMLSLMRGRRTLSWSLAPAQGGAGLLPEMTVELGDYYTRHRLPPATQSPPNKRTTRVTGPGDHTAPGPSDDGGGGGTGDAPQAQGMRTRKRCGADAADAADAEALTAKTGKNQAHGQQLPSGAAKSVQKRKAPSEHPSAKTKSRSSMSKYHGFRMVYLGMYDTDEDAARVFDFAALSLCGVDTQTVINFDKGAYLGADATCSAATAGASGAAAAASDPASPRGGAAGSEI